MRQLSLLLSGSQLLHVSSRAASAQVAHRALFRGFQPHKRAPQRHRGVTAFATMATPNSTDVRVLTYNVLSSSLGGADYFTSCAPEDLHPPTRLARVLARLERECAAGAVICLQEVSIAWAGPLHAFFLQRGYTFVTHLYGGPFNGFMGVGVAFSTARYSALEVDISRISDAKKWPRPPRQGPVGRLVSYARGLASAAFWRVARLAGRRRPDDPLEYAKKRMNAAVFVRLRCAATGAAFGVATYHMPCAFRTPAVMSVHMALVAQRAFALAKGAPFVLCGDFNVKPYDDQYRMYQTGKLEPNCPSYPKFPLHDPWVPVLPAPLRSAYAEAHGAEPDFTNYSKIKDEPEFIDTLDYIFLATDRWSVLSADPIAHRKDVAGPLPNATEPSDHVLVAADLRLLAQ